MWGSLRLAPIGGGIGNACVKVMQDMLWGEPDGVKRMRVAP